MQPAHLASPWVEKYRPRRIRDVYQQEEVKKLLTRIVETGNMPHLLFFGPPGTGKTSSAMALIRELFGAEEAKYRVMELNASDERGIKVVREKIKQYTKTSVAKNKVHPVTGRTLPPWKIVILDEADMMTGDAQAALRRLMEANAATTRFIITCNFIHRIIDPLLSRCSPHRFEPVSEEAQLERLRFICANEKVEAEPAALQALLRISHGDLRQAVNLLHAASCAGQVVTEELLLEFATIPPPHVVRRILAACSTSEQAVNEVVEDFECRGWNAAAVLEAMVIEAVDAPHLSDLQKASFLHEIGATEFAVTQGANARLQLLALCQKLRAVLREAA